MLIIRPTASLAKKMKIKLLPNNEVSDSLLGDWSSINLNIARHQLVMSLSEKSRLAVICKAAPYSSWHDRFLIELKKVFQVIGVSEKIASNELGKMENIVFAKTNCRSTLGAMNDFRFQVEYEIRSRRLAPGDYLGLSMSLSGILTRKDGQYIRPKEKTLELLNSSLKRSHLRLVE